MTRFSLLNDVVFKLVFDTMRLQYVGGRAGGAAMQAGNLFSDHLLAGGKIKAAIMGGGMSWVSERNLTAAISNAGGVGVVACGSMDPELLTREIAATQLMSRLS